MTPKWIVWHRISSVHYTTQVVDQFLHVVKVGDKWFIRYNDVLYRGFSSMSNAFEYAEGFALGLRDKQMKEKSEDELNGDKT